MYCIPMEDLIANGNAKSIKLRTEPTANGQGFQTYQYKVQI